MKINRSAKKYATNRTTTLLAIFQRFSTKKNEKQVENAPLFCRHFPAAISQRFLYLVFFSFLFPFLCSVTLVNEVRMFNLL